MSEALKSLRLPLIIDAGVMIALAVQWGTNTARLDQLERQIIEIKSAQVTEARIVRIEEQQRYMVKQVEDLTVLLREYLEEQRKDRR
jgi:hypothetical protein